MSASDTRKLLGRSRSFGSRSSIYQADDALEIEVNEQYDVVQKRVLYDDVMMVTIHRELGVAYLVVMGIIALFFLGIAVLIVSLSFDAWPASVIFAIFGLPALIAFLVRLFLRLDVVTVFGRRSKTDLRFALRKQRAREVYGTICAVVRNAHRQAGVDRGNQQADALDVSSPPT
ncbi:MAG: hypothetical protein M3P06_25385 [Acidobacteriota bacterium]|nr:hypothetical protein [Acidobacteriota bacterium]